MKVPQKLQSAFDARIPVVLVTTYGAKYSGTITSINPLQLRCADIVRTFDARTIARIEYE